MSVLGYLLVGLSPADQFITGKTILKGK